MVTPAGNFYVMGAKVPHPQYFLDYDVSLMQKFLDHTPNVYRIGSTQPETLHKFLRDDDITADTAGYYPYQ